MTSDQALYACYAVAAAAYKLSISELATVSHLAAKSFTAAAASISFSPEYIQTSFLERDANVADARLLEHGMSVQEISTLPLWNGGQPKQIGKTWDELKSRLLALDEDWDVWTDWYEDRLAGRPADEWLEVQRVLIPDAVWKRGPKIVNARIKQLIAARQAQLAAPQPVAGVVEVEQFETDASGTIIATGDGPLPALPQPGSDRDHRKLLADCRKAGEQLLKALKDNRFNVRPDYAEAIAGHLEALPKRIGSGNIHSADREARFILTLMTEDADALPPTFVGRLKGFLESHLGLRVYYPEVEAFYQAVQTGKLTLPFPLDAFRAFRAGISAATPTTFAPSVGVALDGGRPTLGASTEPVEARTPPPIRPPQPPPPPPPLRDPLGELDPTASENYRRGSTLNGLWKVILMGDTVRKSAESYVKSVETLSPYARILLEWLKQFNS